MVSFLIPSSVLGPSLAGSTIAVFGQDPSTVPEANCMHMAAQSQALLWDSELLRCPNISTQLVENQPSLQIIIINCSREMGQGNWITLPPLQAIPHGGCRMFCTKTYPLPILQMKPIALQQFWWETE